MLQWRTKEWPGGGIAGLPALRGMQGGKIVQCADPVDDQHIQQRPLLESRFNNPLQLPFGHAGIVFQGHAAHRFAVIGVAHGSDKDRRRAVLAAPVFIQTGLIARQFRQWLERGGP